jgi:putative phage-type endonuclease
MKLLNLKQGTKTWLDWRSTKVTASDSPIIMGMSPFKSYDELLNEKYRRFATVATPRMQRGIDLEPIALREFEKETGLIMFPCVAEHENGWMGASFDGMTIEGDAILEIKCPGKKDHSKALSGECPEHYFAQIQHQIYVADVSFSYYYSFDGVKGFCFEVKRDNDFIQIMLEKEFEFWNCLQNLNLERKVLHD